MSTKLEDYEVIDIIGSGSFGTCYKVKNIHTNEFFVWKAIDYGTMTEDKKLLLISEVKLLSELNHPNIVKYYNRILHKETTTLYIIMEWCKGGDLAKVIKHHKKTNTWMEEGFIWHVMYQTGRALQACHTRLGHVTVLHRDIKPANVFLDEYGNVKLGDFGLARVINEEDCHSQTLVGTPYYMSPEVMKGAQYNRKSDIWALGCLVYELCALAPPFDGLDIHELANNIKLGRFNPIPQHYSENLVKIIKLMLSVKHEFRPTVEIILHHPVVVANISRAKRTKGTQSLEKNRSSGERRKCEASGLKDLSLSERDPLEVSENAFKEKWLSRLEVLRQKEAKLRDREETLERRERMVLKREKQVVLLEREAREKLSRAEVYLHQCKENKVSIKFDKENDSSYSADPCDTSVEHTTAKVDPSALPKPNFVRAFSERRKHVHFNNGFPRAPDSVLKPDNKGNIMKPVASQKEGSTEHVFSEFGVIERKLSTKEQEMWSVHNRVLNYATAKLNENAAVPEKEIKPQRQKKKVQKTITKIIL